MSTTGSDDSSTKSGSLSSLGSLRPRPSMRNAKSKTHKSRREKRQELISRLKPSAKDGQPLPPPKAKTNATASLTTSTSATNHHHQQQHAATSSTIHVIQQEDDMVSEMSDILNNVANEFVAKNFTSPANIHTETVRRTKMEQSTKRTYASNAFVQNDINLNDDLSSASYASSVSSFFDDGFNFDVNQQNQSDTFGHLFSDSHSIDSTTFENKSAHIVDDRSPSTKTNLGGRYSHLVKKKKSKKAKKYMEQAVKEEEEVESNDYNAPLENSSHGSKLDWPASPSTCNAFDTHNPSNLKRCLSPDQPAKRALKSPRSSDDPHVVRNVPSDASGESSSSFTISSKIASALKGIRTPTSEGTKKQVQTPVPIIRPPHSRKVKDANEIASAEYRPKISFDPSVNLSSPPMHAAEPLPARSDTASKPAHPPASEEAVAKAAMPFEGPPNAVHIRHDSYDGSMSSASASNYVANDSNALLPAPTVNVKPAFDVKIAVLGGSKSGKSTVLNAFFQEKFADSSRSGVNYYELSRTHMYSGRQNITHLPNRDNEVAVGKSGKKVTEHHFDVELEGDILHEMRDDARLVFVDVPSFFPEGSHYLDYLEKKWDEMDCAIVVLDAMSTNSVENVTIMNFVKHCLKKRKDLPIVIVCNKVDDTEDDEIMAMVDAVRQESLAVILGEKSREVVTNLAFIPISAKSAYWYRSASKLSFEEFTKIDQSIIDDIGREEIGRFRWKRMSTEERYTAIYSIMQDEEEYRVRLRASNFDILMNSLDHFIGGKKKQDRMICKQLESSLKKLSHDSGYYDRLVNIFRKSFVLDKSTSHLKETFWSLYSKSYQEAYAKFEKSPSHVATMHGPLQVLIRYASELHEEFHRDGEVANEKEEDAKKIVASMKEAIKQQCALIVEKAYQWKKSREQRGGKAPTHNLPEHWKWVENRSQWKNTCTGRVIPGNEDENPGFCLTSWDDMTPRDWVGVIDSIMLMCHNKYFCENFGAEIVELKWLDRTGKFVDYHYAASTNKYDCIEAANSDDEVDRMLNNELTLTEKDNKDQMPNVMRISIPDSPSDAKHWGHMAWLFGEYMSEQEKKSIALIEL
jgi:GTPase SAR1 family protein